ncbi:MAG: MBL fold metallo-hydrolase [Dehalobacterium sp.]
METREIKIQYLFQSGFSVEIKDRLFIFDYMEGQVDLEDKSTMVFCSHGHLDHYNTAIFNWQEKKQNIQYILSDDIMIEQQKLNICQMSPYDEIQVEDVKIKAYGSTDMGVSFLVKWAGVTLFHAGDLNWWHWGDDTPEETERAEKEFKNEIATIRGEVVDLAFFPVDPRLEDNYSLGADYFIEQIKPKFFIPMHFGEDFKISGQYAKKMKGSPTRIILFTEREQEIVLNI